MDRLRPAVALVLLLLGCKGEGEPPPSLRSSSELLLALQQRLTADDEAGWGALGLAEAADFDTLCPEPSTRPDRAALRAAMRSAFRECRSVASWPELERGFPDRPLHHGINRDDRRCDDVEGCPGLERLCKSELFGYVPNGPQKVEINLHGAYRRESDGTLLVGIAPRCMARDQAP